MDRSTRTEERTTPWGLLLTYFDTDPRFDMPEVICSGCFVWVKAAGVIGGFCPACHEDRR